MRGAGRRASFRANSRLQAQLREAEEDSDSSLPSPEPLHKVKMKQTMESEDGDEDDDDLSEGSTEAMETTSSEKSSRRRRGCGSIPEADKGLVGAAKRKAQTPRVLKHKLTGAGETCADGEPEVDPASTGASASPSSPETSSTTVLTSTSNGSGADATTATADGATKLDCVKNDPNPFDDDGFADYDSPDEVEKQQTTEMPDHSDQPSIFRWECHVCKEVFRNWNSLSVHCRQTHNVPAQVVCLCAKVLASRASIIKHRLKHTNAYKYKCDKCDKAFHRKSLFDLHVLSHVPKEEQPYVCCKCARRFHCEALLRHHERVHLPREERLVYPCSVCAKKFSSRSNVSAHLKAVHFGERPFVCDQCGHSFTSKGILQEHLTIHSDETPFKCTQCKKSFKTKYRLKIHMDTHRETPYQCPICPHQLSTRRTLRMHLLVHKDVKAYQCATCGKAFKRSKDLKNHHNLHTGMRPYTCTFCPRTFANGSNCRAHKRKMHPEELRAYEAQLAAAAEAGEAPPPPPPRAIAPPPPGSGQQQHQQQPMGSIAQQQSTTVPVAPSGSPVQPPTHVPSTIDVLHPPSDLKPPPDLKPPSTVPHPQPPPCSNYERHSVYDSNGGLKVSASASPVVTATASRQHEYAPSPSQIPRILPPHLSDLAGVARLGENGLCRSNPHAASELEAAVGSRVMAINLNVRRGNTGGPGDMISGHISTLAPLNLNVSEMQHANRQQQQQHQQHHPGMSEGMLSELEDGGYLSGPRRTVDSFGGRSHMGLAAAGLGALTASGLAAGLPVHRQQPQQQHQQHQQPQQQGMTLNHRVAGMHQAAQHSPDQQAYHLYQHHGESMPSAVAAAIAHSTGGMSVPAFPGNPYIHHNMGYGRGGNAM